MLFYSLYWGDHRSRHIRIIKAVSLNTAIILAYTLAYPLQITIKTNSSISQTSSYMSPVKLLEQREFIFKYPQKCKKKRRKKIWYKNKF